MAQSEDFAKAIAFAWWPFLAIFKMLSFFEYYLFFLTRFLHRTTGMCCRNFFIRFFLHFPFLTQNEDFARAIAFAWWPLLAIFKMLSCFESEPFLGAVFCIEQLQCV